MIFARAFTKAAWKEVGQYNQTTIGKRFPIILVTARSLPKTLQNLELFAPINSQGTPDRDTQANALEAPESQVATTLTPEEALRLERRYGLDLTALGQPSSA